MKTWDHFPISATRFAAPKKACCITGAVLSEACSLHYGKQPNVGWRFVVFVDGGYAQVGAIYPTKDELLADLPRYAE